MKYDPKLEQHRLSFEGQINNMAAHMESEHKIDLDPYRVDEQGRFGLDQGTWTMLDRAHMEAHMIEQYPEFHAFFTKDRDPVYWAYSYPGKHVYGDGFYVAIPLEANLADYPPEADGLEIHYEKLSRPVAQVAVKRGNPRDELDPNYVLVATFANRGGTSVRLDTRDKVLQAVDQMLQHKATSITLKPVSR